LSVKWHELLWWRARHARQPWDCGCLAEGPAAPMQLARFRPRRPTLIVVKGFGADRLLDAMATFNATRMDYHHPVRVLVIDTEAPSVLALRFDAAAAHWHTPLLDRVVVTVIDFADVRFKVPQSQT
ncbi:MAG: hypothetical protein ABI212_11965, partial [Burkholderiaceae bacterium]